LKKQFGNKDGLEDVIILKRRLQYEEQVNENPENYDAWLDYAMVEELPMTGSE
jgi:crooked neck